MNSAELPKKMPVLLYSNFALVHGHCKSPDGRKNDPLIGGIPGEYGWQTVGWIKQTSIMESGQSMQGAAE
jgi:hypothetical protein